MPSTRRLEDLISVGPAILRDFELLGVRNVSHLAKQNPIRLYQKLCKITGQHIDVLLPGHVLLCRRTSSRRAVASRPMPVVVLEP